MPRIHALPPLLANQIAAGEVVERPASVLKELLENSLDAGATELLIEVEEGGRRLIRVRDDGHGIVADDLALALCRHATSKISTIDDLAAIITMGFRGEALPSIAAVSKLRVVSRAAYMDKAFCVAMDGSASVSAPQPAVHPPGTTVEVRDLFFNTPARRRFLRAARTEFAHVEEVVRRLALARHDVAFTLRHDGKAGLQVSAAGSPREQQRRLTRLLGEGFTAVAREVDAAAEGLSLRGWVVDPGSPSTSAIRQYFLVNDRSVRDASLSHAVRHALGNRLPPGSQPGYVLHLGIDPRYVDVNVHPAKNEVRFREPRFVHDFVSRALMRALDAVLPLHVDEHTQAGLPEHEEVQTRRTAGHLHTRPGTGKVREQLSVYGRLHPPAQRPSVDAAKTANADATEALIGSGWLARIELDGLYLYHLPALRRSLALEVLARVDDGERPAALPVLVPPSVQVSPVASEAVEEAGSRCIRLGLDLRRLGPDCVAPVEVPCVLAGADLAGLTKAVARLLAEKEPDPDEKLIKLLASFAAHDSAPAPGEMARLLEHAHRLSQGDLDALRLKLSAEDIAAVRNSRSGAR